MIKIPLGGVHPGTLWDEAMLAKQELYWQYQLRTFTENGGHAMNIKDDLTV